MEQLKDISDVFKEHYRQWTEDLHTRTQCSTFLHTDTLLYAGMYGQKDPVDTEEQRAAHIAWATSSVNYNFVDYLTVAPASTYKAQFAHERTKSKFAEIVRDYGGQGYSLFADEQCRVPLTRESLREFDSRIAAGREVIDGRSVPLYRRSPNRVVEPFPRYPANWATAKTCGILMDFDRFLTWWRGQLEIGAPIIRRPTLEDVRTYALMFSRQVGNVASNHVSPQPLREFVRHLNNTIYDDLEIRNLVELGGFQAYNEVSHYVKPNGAVIDTAQGLHSAVAAIITMTSKAPRDTTSSLYALSATRQTSFLYNVQDAYANRPMRNFKSKIETYRA